MLGNFIRAVLRAMFILAGVLLAAMLTAFGVCVALAWLLWQRLRGRPAPPFPGMRRGSFAWRRGGAAPFGRSPSPASGEVVDVEVREISSDSEREAKAIR